MEQFRNACRVLVGKPEGKRPLGRPRRRLEDNIKINFKKWVVMLGIGWKLLAIEINSINEHVGNLKANNY